MQRIVIDPNILASVLLGGITRTRFDWLLQQLDRFEICYSEKLLDEIRHFPDVPYFQKKGISFNVIQEFIRLFQSFAIKIIVSSKVRVGRDQNDYYLLSLARDSKANYLITGDPDLLELGKYGTTTILGFKEFVELFFKQPSD